LIKETIEVTNPKGIHARPSALIVQTAMQHKASIHFELRGMTANAKQVIELLSLGAFHGDIIDVTIDGEDEVDALQSLRDIFALNFNDKD
jgi:phosphocarrier protein HPr